ncbi:uncharacterized protein phf11 isoform X2 [Siphateles boraxobius]|uniref:uncharacterized protein phf11 isoform X2 n=1 Tax=Siphateles boraxobius TaxID=180520 RepID=UPI00406336AE
MSTCPTELKMGSGQYRSPCKIICVLCEKSDEDEITGPLSSKEKISAHQNCLLFASGIYCRNSPTYDDLFGFTVEDVTKERRRGKKLFCHHCKKRGATAGCDVKRCKHSYHYPCAIEARGRAKEDYTAGKYILFCELHDPDLKETSSVSLQGASTSGLCGSKRRRSVDNHGPRPDRSESNSSIGSSEASLSQKKNKDDVDPMFAPVESDAEECTPPKQHNQSTPDPKSKGPCEELSPSVTGSLNEGLTSDQKACGSADNPGELHGWSISDSSTCLSEVGTPRRKKIKYLESSDDESPNGTDPVVVPVVSDLDESVLPKQPNRVSDSRTWLLVETPRRKKIKYPDYSDDESPNGTDPVVVPVVSDLEDPKQPNSPPVPENTRPCEKLNSSTTGADDNDTDIDSEESQSLLSSEMYHTTVPFNVIVDSGPSAESEYSLELGSPVSAAPEAVCTSPGLVAAPEHEEAPSTSRTSPVTRAPTTDTVSPGTADSTPEQHNDSNGPSGQPGSPQHSRSEFIIEELPETSSPAGVSTSLDRATASDACHVNSTGSTQSNAVIFWTRCNQAGWTEEIFSELVSQLESLGERVQSQEASHQDYDVALKLLEASGHLPCIITQLEQDLAEQERDLQRKKAALRDARAVLGLI